MRIFITAQSEKKLIDGNQGIDEIKNEASKLVNGEFYITYNDKIISTNEDLIMIEDLSELNIVETELGGKGKRKKKVYATPKIIKKRHVNKKLSVLEYYAVEKDGSIKRVKKACTNKTCSEGGVFMADMWNRHYCGKCHTSFIKKNAPKEEPKKKVKKVEEVVEEDKATKGKKGKKGKK